MWPMSRRGCGRCRRESTPGARESPEESAPGGARRAASGPRKAQGKRQKGKRRHPAAATAENAKRQKAQLPLCLLPCTFPVALACQRRAKLKAELCSKFE